MPKSMADPNVKIPAAVAALSARADEIHQSAYPTEAPPPADPPVTPEPGAPPAPPVEPPVTPEVTPEPPVTPPVEPEPELTADQWKHRYLSMKGRFESASEAVRSLTDRNRYLQGTIASMQETPVTPVTPPAPASSLITDEDVSSYGNDFLDVIGRGARAQIDPVVTELRNTVSKLEEKIKGADEKTAQSDRQKMFTGLDEKLPTWREVNLRDDFLAWLQLPDTLSGAIRMELLQSAYERNDTPRVLAFFKGFLSQEAAEAPAGLTLPGQEPPINGGPKTPLEDLAAPGRARITAPSGGPVEKPIITRAQISQFYQAVAAGRYRGRDAEKAADEKVIFDAEREGRIR